MRLRPARPEDLALLRHWDEQPHVIDADPNDDWQWETELERDPDWREQLVAETDGRPIGFVQIIDPAREETHYWGDCGADLRAIDIWIGEEADLGRGYGTRMMRLAIERCFAAPGVRAILIDPLASNHRARHFYERLGFKYVEDRYFGDDHCAVYRLDLARLRDAQPEDRDALSELCFRSKASWGYDDAFMAMSRADLTVTQQRLEAWTTRVAVSWDGAPIGVSAYSVDGEGDAELELLFVDPQFFGRGLGRMLLDDVRAQLRRRGAGALWVLSDPGAEAFYLRAGAERVGMQPSGVIPGRELPWLHLTP